MDDPEDDLGSDLGLVERRVGVLDIGSNSVRLVIYEIYGASFTPVYNEKVLAGLGRDLKNTGLLHPAGKQMALTALKRFKLLTDALGLDDIFIAATAAMRDAKDAPDFIDQIKTETGFDIHPLSGEGEAYMTAMGLIAADNRARGLAADLGGASLEFMQVNGGKPSGGISYQLGPFSMFKGEFAPQDLRPRIEEILSNLDLSAAGKSLYLIGGAWRNLALIHQKRSGYPLRIAYNYVMDVNAVTELARWAYSREGAAELLSWKGISQRRADTLPYAGLMLDILLGKLKPKQVVLASGGLREGLVYDAFDAETKKRSSLFDGCRALAHGNQKAIRFSTPLYDFLQEASHILPSSFSNDNEDRIRKAACLLVGIGKGFHPNYKAKIVFRTIISAPLADLTHKERAYLALILYASYTGKQTTPNDSAISYLLSAKEQLSARIYGQAMRASVVLSGRSRTILSKFNLSADGDGLTLSVAEGFEALLSEQGLQHIHNFATLSGITVYSPKP